MNTDVIAFELRERNAKGKLAFMAQNYDNLFYQIFLLNECMPKLGASPLRGVIWC